MKLPRALWFLAMTALLCGGFGASRSLGEQILPYLGSHDGFVSAHRHELELRNQLNQPEVPGDVIRVAGDQLGERAWARRGINLPLGVVNLVASLLLFIGALRSLARSSWGHGAFGFAARLSIPYTCVAAVVSFVEARDGWDASAALSTNLSLQLGIPTDTLADWELLRDRAFGCAGAALLVAFYLAVAIYLGRPKVKALFSDGE